MSFNQAFSCDILLCMTDEKKLDREELFKKLQEELDKLTVDQLMAQMASNLASLSFKFLGLPPEKNEKFKDLKQARLAIDGLEAFTKLLEKKLSKAEIEVLKSALSNLQILFVKTSEIKSKKSEKEEKDGA